MSVLFLACSLGEWSSSSSEKDWASVATKPRWFSEDKRFSSLDEEQNPEPHLFFDTEPLINYSEGTLFYILTTPAQSQIAYDLDIVTGKLYSKQIQCEQKDVWGKYSGVITNPPFSTGIVPQMLDQLGKPQKIYVFGNEKFYQTVKMEGTHQVRVVGGVIEQICHEGNCQGRNNWDSRLVLIAVDFHDPNFMEIKNINELKEKVDWEYAKAYMQNSLGRNSIGETPAPAVRVVGEIKPGFALKFAEGFAHHFKFDELAKIRSTCLKLYDYVWQDFGEARFNTEEAKTLEEFNQKVATIKKVDAKGKNIKTFGEGFRSFHQKYGKEFQTCTDFVKTESIKTNTERHWFFAWMTLFYKLERMGHIYNCNQRLWQVNPFIGLSTKRQYDPFTQIIRCSDEDLDLAFSQMTNYLMSLKSGGKEYYRYIEYDSGSTGTHNKLYSWINVEAKVPGCLDNNLVKKILEREILPEEVKWVNRSQINEKKKFGIIY